MQPLSDALLPEHIVLEVAARTLPESLSGIIAQLTAKGTLTPGQSTLLTAALQARESLGATCIGRGVVIPHAYPKGLSAPVTAFGRLRAAIDYGAPDGKPVDLIFLLCGPETAQPGHLPFLARLVRLLHHDDVLAGLRAAQTAQAVLDTLKTAEQHHA